ncbi:MAG: carbohydrate ABC transporter permease [Spirochaetota bacterium]
MATIGKNEIAAQEALLKKHGTWYQLRKHRVPYLMIAPLVIGFLVFTIYPQVWVVALSLFRYNGVTPPEWEGIDNFVRAFQRDDIWWKSVWNTFYFSFGKLALELPIALVLAIILNRQIKGKNFFRGLFFLPSVTSAAIMSLVFYFIFSPYQGILNGMLLAVGVIQQPIDWLGHGDSAMIVAMLVSVWQNFGINMILFLAGLQAIPDEFYESASIDGATEVQQFWYITLPALGRMLQVIVMLAIIGSLKTFDIFRVLTNGGPANETMVMMLYIFNYFFNQSAVSSGTSVVPQFGYASSLGVIASVIIAFITTGYLLMSRRLGKNQE